MRTSNAGRPTAAPSMYQFNWPTLGAFVVMSAITMMLYYNGTPFLEALLYASMVPATFVLLMMLPPRMPGTSRTARHLADALTMLANSNGLSQQSGEGSNILPPGNNDTTNVDPGRA